MKSINTNFNIPSPTTSLFAMTNPKMIMTSLKGMNKLYWGDPTNSLTTNASQTPTPNKSSRPFSPISFNSTDEWLSGSSGSAKKYTKTSKWALPLSSETSIKISRKPLRIISNFLWLKRQVLQAYCFISLFIHFQDFDNLKGNLRPWIRDSFSYGLLGDDWISFDKPDFKETHGINFQRYKLS